MKKNIQLILVLLVGLFALTPFFINQANATSGACSSHNGVDCYYGWQADGRVKCNDGWLESATYYAYTESCKGKSKLEIACKDVTAFNWLNYQQENYNTLMEPIKQKIIDEIDSMEIGTTDFCEKAGIEVTAITLSQCLEIDQMRRDARVKELAEYLDSSSKAMHQITVDDTISKCEEIKALIPICAESDWSCGAWSNCSLGGTQSRICNKISNCEGGVASPPTSQSCSYLPQCAFYNWLCGNWSGCLSNGTQTRTCDKISDCAGGILPPATTQSCVYTPPVIKSISPNIIYPGTRVTVYGNNFGSGGTFFSTKVKVNGDPVSSIIYNWEWTNTAVTFTMPNNATSGYITIVDKDGNESNQINFVLTPKIMPCTINDWSCGSWSSCSSLGDQSRICNKISNCVGGIQSPATIQTCASTPPCLADTWQCEDWGVCSPQGIQTRSCSKTFNCSSAETASPATSQYCKSSYQQNYLTPSENSNVILNQDTIIKATVKLICPVSDTMASQGSGTVIDSTGLILTNSHVVDGTSGCLVGFIDDYDDEPYFGDRQIADIYKVSSDADVAVLKLRNPNNKSLASVDITQNNSSNIKLGEILTTYGYPAKFGATITYTSGDFSGIEGDYLKTTAVIESGNSGGGAYLKNGAFIGIPTAVVKGSLNSMGLLLSVNKINSWFNNSIAYNYKGNNNNYSRVSALLENIDLDTLNSLNLYISSDEQNSQGESKDQGQILGVQIDMTTANRLKGKLLLQVEQRGRIWYVNPSDANRYEVTFANALPLFQRFALGINNTDLNKIPLHGQNWTSATGNRLKGKLLLQVQDKGRIWYVDFDGKRWEVTWANLMTLFQGLALGITDADLYKIPEGNL